MEKEACLKALERLGRMDHAFINEQCVTEITAPFGFKGSTYLAHSDIGPDNPKGLQLAEGLTELRGQDAAETAVEICERLGVPYRSMFGRGSRLRECVRAAREYVEQCGK